AHARSSSQRRGRLQPTKRALPRQWQQGAAKGGCQQTFTIDSASRAQAKDAIFSLRLNHASVVTRVGDIFMKAATRPERYTNLQLLLHWLVAALVAFQYLFNEGIMASWHFYAHGDAAPPADFSGANLHVLVGLTVLLLAIVRLA